MLSFDTNILVYAADRHAGPRHTTSISLLNAATKAQAALTEQCLIEFISVVTRKQTQPLSMVPLIVRNWLELFPLLLASPRTVEDVLSLLSEYRLSVWDAHLLALCASNGCDLLLSEDLADGMKYRGVLVLNPFNPANTPTINSLLSP